MSFREDREEKLGRSDATEERRGATETTTKMMMKEEASTKGSDRNR